MPAARQNSGSGPVILGAILLGGYFLMKKVIRPDVIVPLQTKKFVTHLRVTIPGVQLTKSGIQFRMQIQNPNSASITILAIVGTVSVSYGNMNYQVGNVDYYTKTVIKPTAETNFNPTVKTLTLPLVAFFSDTFAGKTAGAVFTFIGSINLDGRVFPVKESVRI